MLALSLLLAGFIVVFVVLILLIVIITVYGKIIQAGQKSAENRREKKKIRRAEAEGKPTEPSKASAYIPPNQLDDDEIPGEIIAVIAAAVDAVYGDKPHKVRSVKRSRNGRSAWGNAGIMRSTRPF